MNLVVQTSFWNFTITTKSRLCLILVLRWWFKNILWMYFSRKKSFLFKFWGSLFLKISKFFPVLKMLFSFKFQFLHVWNYIGLYIGLYIKVFFRPLFGRFYLYVYICNTVQGYVLSAFYYEEHLSLRHKAYMCTSRAFNSMTSQRLKRWNKNVKIVFWL